MFLKGNASECGIWHGYVKYHNCNTFKLREPPKDQTTTYTWRHSIIPELATLGMVKRFDMIYFPLQRKDNRKMGNPQQSISPLR